MARQRRRWQAWQGFMETTTLVILDESGVSTNMTRRYGWAPKGGCFEIDDPELDDILAAEKAGGN